MNLIDYLQQTIGICDVWVDGSFVTEKPDPDDIDLTILIPREVLDRLQVTDPVVVQGFAATIDQETFSPDLHVFVIVSRPRDHPDRPTLDEAAKYWAQWWSVTRENWVKGMAVLRLGETDVGLRILP